MRASLAVLAGALLLAAVPLSAQQPDKLAYKVSFDSSRDVKQEREEFEGKANVLVVSVRFTITRLGDAVGDVHKDYKLVIREDGNKVKEVDVPQPSVSDDLSAVLAMDISGSM